MSKDIRTGGSYADTKEEHSQEEGRYAARLVCSKNSKAWATQRRRQWRE
jgi:hypothetical protein